MKYYSTHEPPFVKTKWLNRKLRRRTLGPITDDMIRDDFLRRMNALLGLDVSGISMDVSEGRLTLTGVVDSTRLRQLVQDISANIAGVREVENQIEIVAHP